VRSSECIGRCATSESRRATQRCSVCKKRREREKKEREREREKREHERTARKKQLTIDDDVSHVWNHDLRGVSFARMYV